jgi:NTE family protein
MRIGLALSGGGALGAAHIGILEELEKNKIKIDSICGTSSGAIIGLLYSVGGIKTIDLFFNRLKEAGIFNKAQLLMHKNMTVFKKISDILSECVGPRTFSDLNINFSCIATNIVTGEAEELSSGDPVRSVMASAAYPGVFNVQKMDDRFYVDGGLTLNLPAKTLHREGIDFVIGSSLYSIPKLAKLDSNGKIKVNLLDAAVRSIDILSKVLADNEIPKCNYCFTPPTESYKWYDFDRVDSIREIGREYAKTKIIDLKKDLNIGKIKKSFWPSFVKN